MTADIRTDPATNARDVTFAVEAGERARVARVEVRADRPEAGALARQALGLEAGDRFGERALQEGVDAARRRVREAGYFEARVDAERPVPDPATGRVAIVLNVDAGRRFAVTFTGVEALPEARLRERLTFPHTGIVDEHEVRASARQMEAAYREAGHHFAEVQGRIEPADGEAAVRFDVAEGPRVTVESVAITGLTALREDRVLGQLRTRPRGLLERGVFSAEALEQDLRALRRLLEAEGLPDARVGPAQVAFSGDRRRARVVIPVEEGPRVHVGSVRVEGAEAFAPETLREAVPLRAGAPWDPALAEEGRRVLERRYARHGYHAARVEVDAARRDGLVDLAYRIEEGPQTRIGRVVIAGLTLTRQAVVRRELPFAEGEPLNPEALLEAQRRLSALGIFDRVDVEPLRPPPAPYADVRVTVREGRPWHVAFGLGYSTFEGFRAFVEGGHDNLFGTSHKLALRLRASERGERGDLTYLVPALFGTRWRGDANLSHERREEIGWQLERSTLALAAERTLEPWLPGLATRLRYGLSLVNRFDVDPTLAPEDIVRGRELVASLTPELTLERRDDPLDPRRGSFHLLAVQGAAGPLGSEVDFLKTRLETHWFIPWPPPTVLALSARLGLATPLGDTPNLPIEERFFAGGSTTVRGYRERRLGPRDADDNPLGGNGLVVLNAEWRFPLWRWLGGALFVDSGAVTADAGDLGTGALRTGAGAGLRVTTPIGPIRLDAGYPLDRVHGDARKWRVYLTIGHPF